MLGVIHMKADYFWNVWNITTLSNHPDCSYSNVCLCKTRLCTELCVFLCVCIMCTHACAYILQLYIMTLNFFVILQGRWWRKWKALLPTDEGQQLRISCTVSFHYAYTGSCLAVILQVISFLLPVQMCILRDKRKWR